MTRPWPDCPTCQGEGFVFKGVEGGFYPASVIRADPYPAYGEFLGECHVCAAHWRGVEEAVLAEHRNIEAALNTAAAIRAREVKP